MAIETEIAWTDSTFNPWWGCQKVGPGCDHCYAESVDKRTGGAHWGPGVERRRTSVRNWNDPLRWNRKADEFFAKHGRRQRVFCASMADVFDNAVDPQWRKDLFELIASTPRLDWLLLTKRIGNVPKMLPEALDGKSLPENVWLGITVVNQEEANRDIAKLRSIDVSVRFLSMEPLIAPVDLEALLPMDEHATDRIHWVIVGGESGHGARPMHIEWARTLRDQCASKNVPFLFKQWGEWFPSVVGGDNDTNRLVLTREGKVISVYSSAPGVFMTRIGKAKSGNELDGRIHLEFPQVTLGT